jgi:hypothetical protein
MRSYSEAVHRIGRDSDRVVPTRSPRPRAAELQHVMPDPRRLQFKQSRGLCYDPGLEGGPDGYAVSLKAAISAF